MRPVITDADTGQELWRVADCAQHCGITEATWRSYARKNMPPPPVAYLDPRIPLWDAEEVKAWHTGRPSQS